MSGDKTLTSVIIFGCLAASSVYSLSISYIWETPCADAVCMPDPGCDVKDRFVPPGGCCEICTLPLFVPNLLCKFVDCIKPNCSEAHLRNCCPACRTGDGCYYGGWRIPNGEEIRKDQCQTCICRDNQLHCKISRTRLSCEMAEKPGLCPPRPNTLFTSCTSTCHVDYGCPGNMKCCDIGCGKSCKDPIAEECQNVVCPFLRCTSARRYKPANKCCHVCEPI